MRVLVLDTWYPAVLDASYERTPALAAEPYDRQWRALMDTFFGTADSYSHYLGELGHPAHEVILNSEPLQHAWAAEHGVRAGALRRLSPARILVAQTEWFDPDVVYVQDLKALPPRLLRRLRGRRRLLVGQIASELPPADRLAPYDLVLTSLPNLVTRLRSLGVQSEYFRIGFDPRVLQRLDARPRETGAAFVGTLSRGRQHARGNELLERVARLVPIDFWGPGVATWPPESQLRLRHRGEVWGLEMYRVLAGARIAVNRHIDVAEGQANNMRLYEATGVGALVVTEAAPNLAELFDPGSEVVTYRGEDELAAVIAHYLGHEDERAPIARAGQARTLGEHTYRHRMHELLGLLESRLR